MQKQCAELTQVRSARHGSFICKESGAKSCAAISSSTNLQDLIQTVQQLPDGAQYWVGLAGAPGSGKTTLATALIESLNAQGIPAVQLSMDGFHLYRKELDQLPDPAEVRQTCVSQSHHTAEQCVTPFRRY